MPKLRKRSLIPRRISAEEAENNVNEYFLRVSGWFMRAKYAVLVLLFVYLTVMLTAYRSYITYDNLAYLLRDFGSSGNVNSGFSDVTYDEQNNMSVCVYKGALAVAGNSSVTLYDSSEDTKFYYDAGYKTAAQLKYAKSFEPDKGFDAQKKGYYTILAQKEGRKMYIVYVYVY